MPLTSSCRHVRLSIVTAVVLLCSAFALSKESDSNQPCLADDLWLLPVFDGAGEPRPLRDAVGRLRSTIVLHIATSSPDARRAVAGIMRQQELIRAKGIGVTVIAADIPSEAHNFFSQRRIPWNWYTVPDSTATAWRITTLPSVWILSQGQTKCLRWQGEIVWEAIIDAASTGL